MRHFGLIGVGLMDPLMSEPIQFLADLMLTKTQRTMRMGFT
jgi:hypothetical protein